MTRVWEGLESAAGVEFVGHVWGASARAIRRSEEQQPDAVGRRRRRRRWRRWRQHEFGGARPGWIGRAYTFVRRDVAATRTTGAEQPRGARAVCAAELGARSRCRARAPSHALTLHALDRRRVVARGARVAPRLDARSACQGQRRRGGAEQRRAQQRGRHPRRTAGAHTSTRRPGSRLAAPRPCADRRARARGNNKKWPRGSKMLRGSDQT